MRIDVCTLTRCITINAFAEYIYATIHGEQKRGLDFRSALMTFSEAQRTLKWTGQRVDSSRTAKLFPMKQKMLKV